MKKILITNIIEKSSKSKDFFELITPKKEKPYYVMKQVNSQKIPYTRLMETILEVETGGPPVHRTTARRRKKEQRHSPEYYKLFIDLIDRMLDYCPQTRIKPTEALNHEFFKKFNIVYVDWCKNHNIII
jgi:serine/threonine protein kinase